MKARKLEDWSKLLAAPRNVQLAVEAGKLTLKDGLRVANAPPEHQQQISQAIEHGQPARKAVIAVLEFAPRKPLDEKGYARRWRSMALAARDLFKALPGSREALHKHQHYWLRWLFELADSLSDLRPDVAARVKNLEEGVDQERLSQLVAIVRGDRQDIGQLEAQAKGMPKHLVLTAKSRLPLAPLTSAAG
jgi:hypothetical protein